MKPQKSMPFCTHFIRDTLSEHFHALLVARRTLQQWMLAIAVLLLLVHVVAGCAVLQDSDAQVASQASKGEARCPQALGVEVACLGEGPLEASDMGEAADFAVDGMASAGAHNRYDTPLIFPSSFPKSIDLQITSPPRRNESLQQQGRALAQAKRLPTPCLKFADGVMLTQCVQGKIHVQAYSCADRWLFAVISSDGRGH